jgi:uncharacterized protein YlxP (DUF503 family)
MHDTPTTILGLLHLALRLPHCHSLKDKRSILKPSLLYLRKQHNLSAAEVADQDQWRHAVLAFATLSTDKTIVENTLRNVRDYFDSRPDLEVTDQQVEIL